MLPSSSKCTSSTSSHQIPRIAKVCSKKRSKNHSVGIQTEVPSGDNGPSSKRGGCFSKCIFVTCGLLVWAVNLCILGLLLYLILREPWHVDHAEIGTKGTHGGSIPNSSPSGPGSTPRPTVSFVPTPKPSRTPSTLAPTPKPTTIRPGYSPYVALTFTAPSSVPTTVEVAFTRAADEWSKVLAGTNLVASFVNAGETFNDYGCELAHDAVIPPFVIRQMHIAVDIIKIDGNGNTLARAGPCSAFLRREGHDGVFLPVLGRIALDYDDISTIVRNGIMEDLAMHEIGHVLGIGTLWKDLLVDGVYPTSGPVQPNNSPFYVGHAARAAYSALIGRDANVPIEDGSYSGISNEDLLRGEGRGSVDCHWKEKVFGNELMTPVIGIGRNLLSTISIKSLEDIGYGVDTSRSDAYSLPTVSRVGVYAVKQQSSTVQIHGDVFRCPSLAEGLRKAKNRERMGRRLRSKTLKALRDG